MKRSTLKRAALVVLLALGATGVGIKVTTATQAGTAKAPVVHTQHAAHVWGGELMLDN